MDLKNKPARPHLANPAKEAAVGMDVKNKPARPRKPSTPRRRRTSGQTIAALVTALAALLTALAHPAPMIAPSSGKGGEGSAGAPW